MVMGRVTKGHSFNCDVEFGRKLGTVRKNATIKAGQTYVTYVQWLSLVKLWRHIYEVSNQKAYEKQMICSQQVCKLTAESIHRSTRLSRSKVMGKPTNLLSSKPASGLQAKNTQSSCKAIV